jgi:LruC domain-containing protein
MKRFHLALSAFTLATVTALPAFALDERVFIDSAVAIPDAVYDVVSTVFPERSSIGAGFLSDVYSPNLVVTEPAHVMATFVHEGASYRNALGYFTYSSDGAKVTVHDAQLVFPNASYADPNLGWGGGKLVPGDTVTLRDASGAVRLFEPGTRIGFFLVAGGWQSSTGTVAGWNSQAPKLPFLDPSSNATVANGVFTTLDELNPEVSTGNAAKARHVAMVRINAIEGFLGNEDFFLTGFEDQRRDKSSDNDFNDLIVIINADPPSAIENTNVQSYDDGDPDPDGDGVEGLQDLFPKDPERAFVVRTPATGYQTIAFEDNYPSVGDADYNDVVVQFAIEEVLSATGQVKDLAGTWHLVARGARHDHLFGLSIPNVPATATGFLSIERFASDGTQVEPETLGMHLFRKWDLDGLPTLRVDSIFPSTMAALSGEGASNHTNTLAPQPGVNPASARFILTFDTAIDRAPLGVAPFDPFIQVKHEDGNYDVHLPGKQPFADRPAHLPTETEAFTTFVDQDFFPWAMLVPYDWRYPLEGVHITDAYLPFATWRSSLGQLATDWYKQPSESSADPTVVTPLTETSRNRPWTLVLGQ